MSPDRCKVCGMVHRRRDPHVWSGEAQDKTVDMLNEVVGNPLLLELLERVQALEAQVAELREQVREQNVISEVHEVHADVHANVNDVHADRAAYQREYMKKWRAERKAKQ